MAIVGIIIISKPWEKQGKQPAAATPKITTDGGDHASSKELGLEQNTESTGQGHDAGQTTGANTQKGNIVQSYPDAKGGNKRRISSEAGMKQGTAEKAPTKGYEGVDDKASSTSFHIFVLSHACL